MSDDRIIDNAHSLLAQGVRAAPHITTTLRSELMNLKQGYPASNKSYGMALKIAELEDRIVTIETSLSTIMQKLDGFEQKDSIATVQSDDADKTAVAKTVNDPDQKSNPDNLLIATWFKAYTDTVSHVLSPITNKSKWLTYGRYKSDLLEGINYIIARSTDKTTETDIKQVYKIFQKFFQKVAESDYLCGKVKIKGKENIWKASFPWLSKAENIHKVLDGMYVNRGHAKRAGTSLSNIDETLPAPKTAQTIDYESDIRQSAEVMKQLGDDRPIEEIIADLKG